MRASLRKTANVEEISWTYVIRIFMTVPTKAYHSVPFYPFSPLG